MGGPFLTADPQRAVAALRAGALAVIPTETVYGLGARVADPLAVARVYQAKGRPPRHPLIVHIGSAAQVPDYASDVAGYARALAEEFWPGPLTLVYPRRAGLPDHVTSGLRTVALRVPDHPLTEEVLRTLAEGVAAPSANRFGRVSPTTPDHVLAELGEVLHPEDVVLDGGPTAVGVESTIVDCTGPVPAILRPGGVTAAAIEQLLGVPPRRGGATAAPGTLPQHYQPAARVVSASPADVDAGPAGAGLIAPAPVATPDHMVRLAAPADDIAYARLLYAALRAADQRRLVAVVVVPPSGSGLAEAIRDRVDRAAGGV